MINSRKIEDLKPLAQTACNLFMEECKKANLNVCITQTLRDAEYQNSLYQQGRTEAGVIVTNCDGYKKKSNHQSGYAWDICLNVKGKEYSDDSFFEKCGAIARKLKITWGGDWKDFRDTPHFEINSNWKAPKDDLKEAVDILNKKGVISTISAWDTLESIEKSTSYLPDLIGNFMKVKFNIKVCCYNDSIAELYQKGIITDLEVWLGSKVPSANNIKFLLIKMSKEV